MSDIRVTGPAAAPSRTLASGPVAAERSQAWLIELERARWQAQPRYEPGAADADASSDAPARAGREPGGNALRQRGVEGRLEGLSVGEDSSHAQPACSQFPSDTPVAVGRALTIGEAALAPPAPLAVPLGDRRARADGAPAADEHAASRASAPPAGTQWQTRSVHVQVGEQSTAVWVRDARLMPDDAVRLLEQLRPLIAKGQDADAPIRLTVNGQPVQQERRG